MSSARNHRKQYLPASVRNYVNGLALDDRIVRRKSRMPSGAKRSACFRCHLAIRRTQDRSKREYPVEPQKLGVPDTEKTYTLAELIDLAEQHNPETRVAWQEAKSKADALGIARSALYPTLTAVALAVSLRTATLIGEYFHRQTEGVFEPVLHVEYLVFDLGGRSGEIDAAKANLLASDFAFNDTHRRIIYQVASAYYRLLNADGQREAAEVSLENAKTVEEDASCAARQRSRHKAR